MALLKAFTTPHGVTGQYHRILKIEIRVAEETAEIVVGVYPDAATRNSYGVPLWHEYIRVPLVDLPQDPRTVLYPFLAAMEDSPLHGAESDEDATG